MWCRPGRSASSRVQQVMLFSAGVPTNARQPEAATELIWFLPSPDAAERSRQVSILGRAAKLIPSNCDRWLKEEADTDDGHEKARCMFVRSAFEFVLAGRRQQFAVAATFGSDLITER